MTDIRDRKKDHVEISLKESSQYRSGTGLDAYSFLHNALPELNYDEIDIQAELLGKQFHMPLFISSMTGGYADAGPVNAIIAKVCERYNLPFGVGSQRAMLENPELKETFSVVRRHAPGAFICSNIGGAQLIDGLNADKTNELINSIEADAVIVHLNPLQELMQPEGDRNFRGILAGIEGLKKNSGVPLIVKETGAGLSEHVARKLLNAGADVLDIAGAGGTSWAAIENHRPTNKQPDHRFNDWGISTAESLRQVSRLEWEREFEIIASGGIRSAFDMAKCLCLGAHFTATAQPVIAAVKDGGEDALSELIEDWAATFRKILLLLGVQNPSLLNGSHLLKKDVP